MFLPTHTPLFSLSLCLSASLSWRQQQQTLKVPPKARAAELSRSNHGLMKHSTRSYKRTATNFAKVLFLLVLCYTVTCGLFDCLLVFAGLLLRVTPFVLYNTYIYIRRSARLPYILSLASYLSLSSVAGNLS